MGVGSQLYEHGRILKEEYLNPKVAALLQADHEDGVAQGCQAEDA